MNDDYAYCPQNCYWFNQGKCFLSLMPEQHVRETLVRSPQAREDALRCRDSGCCTFPSPETLLIAQKDLSVRPSDEVTLESERRQNLPYVDHSRHIGPGVFHKPPNKEES